MRTSSRTLENTAARGRFSLVHFALYLPLPIWLFIVLWAGATGVFESAPSKPPLPLLVAVTGPPLAFAVFYRASARFRGFIFGIDLRLLTALQAWRVLGGMFPVLYSFGLLPGLFAWPAGVGDVAVGVVAPFALLAMVRGAPTWQRQVKWLNIAGLLDFAAAVGTGVLTSNSAFGILNDGVTRASSPPCR